MRRKNTTSATMKDYIAQSLFVLMRKRSFALISIGEITEKAGVNRSTYYRNFKSREDIVRFYVKKIWNEYRIGFDQTLSFENHLQKLLTHYIKYKTEFLLIYKNGLAHLVLDALNDFFKPAGADATMSLEDRYKIHWYTGAIYNTLLLWFSDEMRESPERISEIYVKIIPNSTEREFLTGTLHSIFK